jgi:hypothetical protein
LVLVFGSGCIDALFRFKNKTLLLIEVDAAATLPSGVSQRNGPLEPIVVVLAIACRRFWALYAQQVSQFADEALRVRHLTST